MTGLKDGDYTLKINGVPTATLTAKELGRRREPDGPGFRPAGQDAEGGEGGEVANPIAAQGQAILAAVAAKENLVGQWRGLSQKAHAPGAAAGLKDELAALGKQVEVADEKIREAAVPQKLHFELSPAP